ncbi:hypothetical protein GCM10009789_65050 [Kribbella sancticallisti]|uniref:LigA protein n=1 Tax=Kribbella sancticallisti TaxID=460087 RepID=A0ABP4Q888_9ACTN
MNPTDKVDDLLAKAGAQWRAGQPSAPEPDLDRIVQSKRPRRWVPVLAAASVAAIAAGLVLLPDAKEPAVAPPVSPASAATTDATPGTDSGKAEDLLVRNGDKVTADGVVIAVPGKDPVLCADLAQTAIGYPPGKEPAPSCPASFAVKLVGLDLDKLSNPTTTKGVRSGTAHLVGVWSNRTITVQEQGPMPTSKPDPYVEEPVPCAAPAGGWQSKPSNIGSQTMIKWLDARANQVTGPAVLYPKGRSRNAPVVVRIGVAHGDLDEFRREIAKVYEGNLCVVRARFSRTDVDQLQAALTPVFDQQLGLSGSGGPGLSDDGFTVSLLVLDEKVRAALVPIGLDKLTLRPKVKPLR